ncbi:MAG: hypothetical protein OHK0046_41940 [Anaerolineae bacterium]
MTTKTERILKNLPSAFNTTSRESVLFALLDAFGNELQGGENALAAVLQAHWVDYADAGSPEIDDLRHLAALYGLAPRDDEAVEDFRTHLKAYVGAFLEGTVTVQGLLRLTAATLGLTLEDDPQTVDRWWLREEDHLVTITSRVDSAALNLLGVETITAVGQPAVPPRLVGRVNLKDGLTLPACACIAIKFNSLPVQIVTFTADETARFHLNMLVETINAQMQAPIASVDGPFLVLTGNTLGRHSTLDLLEEVGDGVDVAELLFGLPPRRARGQDAADAHVESLTHPQGVVDLRSGRYLRLNVDDAQVIEVDCAGEDIAHTALAHIQTVINAALGADVAALVDNRLVLRSTQPGALGVLEFQPNAHDAVPLLFGANGPRHTGRDAQPAQLISRRNLSLGITVDPERPCFIRLLVETIPYLVQLHSAEAGLLRADDVVTAINTTTEAAIAAFDGQFLRLTAPSTGTASMIALENLTPEDYAMHPGAQDVLETVFGLPKRGVTGEYATRATIQGTVDLSDGVNVLAENHLRVRLDHALMVDVDVRAYVPDPAHTTLDDVMNAINEALGVEIATAEDGRLVLTSPSEGAGSALVIELDDLTVERRFVTRAVIADEAATQLFGYVQRTVHGTPATSARITGRRNLRRGCDLRHGRYLRVVIDGEDAVEIDCAGQRPRATLLNEIIASINQVLGQSIASDADGYLVLRSPLVGEASSLLVEPTRARDLSELLFSDPPGTYYGTDASRVYYRSTVKLANGVDLSERGTVRLTVDQIGTRDIELAGDDPTTTTLAEIVKKINDAFGAVVAEEDDGTLLMISQAAGSQSRIIVHVSEDVAAATARLFGLSTTRTYQGQAAQTAEIVSIAFNTVDVRVRQFMRLAVDHFEALSVDCAAFAANPGSATRAEIVRAINHAFGLDIAQERDGCIVLRSIQSGTQGRLMLEPFHGGDAAINLFGDGALWALGMEAQPATLIGEIALRAPLDLSHRHVLRLAIDDGRPFDIAVRGTVMTSVSPAEVVRAINAKRPGLAALDKEGYLHLTAPSTGEHSRLALLPLRHLELMEYPPETIEITYDITQHGETWSVDNRGAADVHAAVLLESIDGTVGPGLVNVEQGWSVRVLNSLMDGESVELWAENGLRAAVHTLGGSLRMLRGDQVLVGPWGRQAHVPMEEEWILSGGLPASLQLNNPFAPHIVNLTVLDSLPEEGRLTVQVSRVPDDALHNDRIDPHNPTHCLIGRVTYTHDAYHLVDASGQRVVDLQSSVPFDFAPYVGQTVRACGKVYTGIVAQMFVASLACIFNVHLHFKPPAGNSILEDYHAVTLGDDPYTPEALVWQLLLHSRLARAESLEKTTILKLPQGRTHWRFVSSMAPRMDDATYNQTYFPGGHFTEYGVFNVSRFTHHPPENYSFVYASSEAPPPSPMRFAARWTEHRMGAFVVNLPADLPARFGGRYGTARFGAAYPESYTQMVMEPPEDEAYLVTHINDRSHLVIAAYVEHVPPGWTPSILPFRAGHWLRGGRENRAARLYLGEPGFEGFIELQARSAGGWGNAIKVSARAAGPAMFDLMIHFAGDHFENAREIVLGEDQPILPARIGVLQAKAAGIRAQVTRDRS